MYNKIINDFYLENDRNKTKNVIVPFANNLFNKVLCTVQNSIGEVVLKRKFQDDEIKYQRYSISKFFPLYNYIFHLLGHFENGEFIYDILKTDLLKTWYGSITPKRYKDIYFYPGENKNTNDKLNLFTGFKYKQTKFYNQEELIDIENNELKLFINHIKDNWCESDETIYNYTIKWIGSTVKHPEIKLKTALVLKGEPGSGKGVPVDMIQEMLGDKYISRPASTEDLTKQFGLGSLTESVLLFLDEAFWGGDKKLKGLIKKLITEKYANVEKKYLNSYLGELFFNVIFSSNEEKVVNIDLNQRRFLVLNTTKMVKKYYTDMIEKTDYQVLYNYFCSKDYTDFIYEDVPTSKYTQEQQVHSLDTVADFIIKNILQEDLVNDYISKSDIYELYQKETRFAEKVNSFWKLFKRYLPKSLDYKDRKITLKDYNGDKKIVRVFGVLTNLEGLRNDFKESTGLSLMEFE